MTKRSTSKTSIVTATTGVSLAGLAEAGITEFKLTKEDVIDLLVGEATASVEAEIAAFKAENAAITSARLKRRDAAADAIKAWYLAQPAGAALATTYPAHTICVLGESMDFVPPGESAHADGDNEDYHNYEAAVSLTLPLPKELALALSKDVSEAYDCERVRALQLLHVKLKTVEGSTKKLKTQLVRKILAGSETGADVLSNVKGLSADFLAALTTSNTRGY